MDVASDGGSLYYPPDTADSGSVDDLSEGDSVDGASNGLIGSDGSFGSLADLVVGDQADWLALTGMALVDEL